MGALAYRCAGGLWEGSSGLSKTVDTGERKDRREQNGVFCGEMLGYGRVGMGVE